MKNCETFFRVTRRAEGVGSSPRLRRNEVRWKKGHSPEGRPSDRFGEATGIPAPKTGDFAFQSFSTVSYGIDTDFLVACEIVDHPFHAAADRLLRELLGGNHHFALAPQTLAELIHVVTDPRRMPVPLGVTDAISRAENWWQGKK